MPIKPLTNDKLYCLLFCKILFDIPDNIISETEVIMNREFFASNHNVFKQIQTNLIKLGCLEYICERHGFILNDDIMTNFLSFFWPYEENSARIHISKIKARAAMRFDVEPIDNIWCRCEHLMIKN
jgi:hypothetical protein